VVTFRIHVEIIWRDGEMGNGFLNGCRSVPFKNVECKSVQDERIQENEQIGFFGNPFTAARERIFVNEFVQRNQSIHDDGSLCIEGD
jgi:hypothetical protein